MTKGFAGRGSTAMRAADLIRTQIATGQLRPGMQLSEEAFAGPLRLSRNTLREAFRMLTAEGLLVHELHRGVFVNRLAESDIVDIYRMRRLVECAAVAQANPDDAEIAALRAAVATAHACAAADDWQGVGTANLSFHAAVVALARSRRLADAMQGLQAQLRLLFGVMTAVRDFYEPYMEHNGRLAELIAAGKMARAATDLAVYLDRAERQLLEFFGNVRAAG